MTKFDCLRLINTCVQFGIMTKPKETPDLVYVFRGGTDGKWCCENILDVSEELQKDEDGQRFLINELKEQGVEFVPLSIEA